jgi:DNA-binding CsgD family transcriptional regulator
VARGGETAGVRARRSAGPATDRELAVVAAVLDAGSEKAAAHRLGLSHSTVKHHLANARSKVGAETTAQLVWILATRLPEGGDANLANASGRPRSDIRYGDDDLQLVDVDEGHDERFARSARDGSPDDHP